MPATATPIPETVSSGLFIEALAGLEAVELVLCFLNGDVSPRPDVGEPLVDLQFDLHERAFGRLPKDDDEYESDAVLVAVRARGAELATEMLDKKLAAESDK